jgi:hypothetical protein
MDLHLFSASRLIKVSMGAVLAAVAAGCAEHHYYGHRDRYDDDRYAVVAGYETYPGDVVVEAPPPPIYERVPARRSGYIWIGGYYAHDGRGYHWREGHYEREPYRGARYDAGRWEHTNRGYVWRNGRWH